MAESGLVGNGWIKARPVELSELVSPDAPHCEATYCQGWLGRIEILSTTNRRPLRCFAEDFDTRRPLDRPVASVAPARIEQAFSVVTLPLKMGINRDIHLGVTTETHSGKARTPQPIAFGGRSSKPCSSAMRRHQRSQPTGPYVHRQTIPPLSR